jgi:asparagine synthase (glutamine-hydrolysing)
MIFIGWIKQRAANIVQSTFAAVPFLDWQDWESIKVNDKNMQINLFYNRSSPKKIINNSQAFLCYDDELYIFKNGCPRKINGTAADNLFRKEKIDFIKRLQSNVNIFLYDKSAAEVYLVSNRATSGRMFYIFQDESLYFSNDFSLLVKLKGLSLNEVSLYAYARFGAVPEDITFDKSIKVVPVAHYGKVNFHNGSVEYTPFFRFDYTHVFENKNGNNSSLLQSAEDNLKANAGALTNKPVNILISGGIDSSLFAFYLREYTADITGHFCSFGDHDPEKKYAEAVSRELQIPLRIHTLYDKDIIKEIEDTAANTSYSHSDYSNISLNFLIRKIKEEFGPGSRLVECNGGDDGFGYPALKKIAIWEKLYHIPDFLLNLLASLVTNGNSWMYDTGWRRRLFHFYRARGKSLYLSHMIGSAAEKLFKNGKIDSYNKELKDMITYFFTNNIASNAPGGYEKMNTAQFFHINSRLWTAKGYSPAQRRGIEIVYPFTWKNILDIQSKIPLSIKLFNNEVKWPLKKLLEKYMPKEFIYRQKSGFHPPLSRWLQNGDNYNYFYTKVMEGFTINRFKRKGIEKILKIIARNNNVSHYASNLIWSMLFFEVWMQKNKIPFQNR